MKSRRARGRYAYANYDPTIICVQGVPKFRQDFSFARFRGERSKRGRAAMGKEEEVEKERERREISIT